VVDDTKDELGRLQDERAILDTLYRYSHCLDYGREEEWVDCFIEDGVWDSRRSPIAALGAPGRPNQPWIVRGHDELAKFAAAHTRAPEAWHKHLLCEPMIDIDGDRAQADSYFVRVDLHPTGSFIRAFGRYRDTLVRCPDDRWRFEHRIAEIDGTHPIAEPTVGPDVTQQLAIEDIKRLKARYCRTVDTKQWDELRDLFTEDAEFHWAGGEVVKGRNEVVDRLRASAGDAVTVHQVSMPDIEIVQAASGATVTMPDAQHRRASTARGTWGLTASKDGPDGTTRVWAYYDETYDLDPDGKWRISSVRLIPLRAEHT
jgi:hypothetical protein